MPLYSTDDYRPRFWHRNNHVNTIFPFYFRPKINPNYIRERVTTRDGDFIDLDRMSHVESHRVVLLCHGLEGSSNSQYIENTASYLFYNGWDVVCMNFRSCSGEMNRRLKMYHSGATDDVHDVLEIFMKDYDEVSLVGYSLGGNVVLKYLTDGNYRLSSKIKSGVGVSVPVDLRAGAAKISHWYNRGYEKSFLKSLSQKMVLKHSKYPEDIPIHELKNVRHLVDFDDYFTGPIHGFRDAEDYYAQCNSKQFLGNASLPILVINAKDDPFLPDECYPVEIAKQSKFIHLLTPKFGGHVGFTTFGAKTYWNEKKVLQFIDSSDDFLHYHRADIL